MKWYSMWLQWQGLGPSKKPGSLDALRLACVHVDKKHKADSWCVLLESVGLILTCPPTGLLRAGGAQELQATQSNSDLLQSFECFARFLVCLPEPKTGALRSVGGVFEQLQASNADGAGSAWSGGHPRRDVIRHGAPKIPKPERGRFLREFGRAPCSLDAGLQTRREAETEEAETESKFRFCFCSAPLRLMALGPW